MAFNHKENCANKPVKNILILGETGVGKSTWINGVANYFHYDSLDDACNKDIIVHIPVCFYQFNQMIKIGKESKNENLTQVGQSATQKPKIYTFTKGSQAYINLIDTPGFGGSSVTAKDMENLDEILAYISNMKNLDAICILLKPNISRLTLTFRYYIQQLFVRLNKSVKNNIIFCFTHSRCAMYGPGDTFPVLNEELAKKCIGIKAIYNDKNRSDKKNNCFCFDNEAFRYILCVKNGKKVLPGIHKTYEESWNQAKNETIALFKKVDNLVPYNVADTISLTQAQNTIKALMIPLAKSLCFITNNIITSQENNYQTEATNFDNDNVKKNSLVIADSCKPSYANTIANNCSTHMYWYITKVKEEKISDDKQELKLRYNNVLRAKNPKLDQIEDRKTQTTKKVEELQKEKQIILETTAMFSAYLEINSLIPYDDAVDCYIKRMIQEKDKNIEPNKDSKIIKLKEVLNCYEEKKKYNLNAITNNSIGEKLSAENINKQKDKLISLKHTGKELKNVLTSFMNSLEKKQNERRQHVIGKIENVFSYTMNNNQDNFNNGKTNNNGNENESYESLRCVTNESTHLFENQKIYAKCGNQARSEYLALFKMIDLIVPYKCFDSIKEYEDRKIAISLIKSIEECLSVINDNIRIAKNFSTIFQRESIESFNIEKALKLKGVSLSINCLDYPNTVCTDKNCIECVSLGKSDIIKTNFKTICHKYCLLEDVSTQVTNNPKVGYCDAFSTGPCNKCGHTYDVHMQITYTATKVLEDFISEDAQKLIMAKNSKCVQIKEMEKLILEKVKELQEVGEIISEAAVKFGAFLVKVALFAYEDVLKKFIDTIELSDDKKVKIQQCNRKQKELILCAIANVSNNGDLTANGIINLKDQLLNLSNQVGKTFSKTFKDVLTSVNNCSEKMKNIRQKCTIQKVKTNANNSAKNFRFNIEAFRYLECTIDEKEFGLGTQETYLETWNQYKSKPLALFKMTDSLVAYNREHAVIANQARKISSALIGPMVECKNLITDNIMNVRELNNKIQKSNSEAVDISENIKFKSISLPTNRIIHPLTICIHRNCFYYISIDKSHINNTSCKTICRNHCLLKDAPTQITKNPKMELCDVFRSDQKCKVCDHTYNDHMQITYTAKNVKVEFLSVEAQKEISAKKSKCEQIEELKRQTLKKVAELEEERKIISIAFVTIRAFLVKNALVAYNNVFGKYIELIIKDEEEKLKLLKDVSIEERKNILLDYKELKRTILNTISNGSKENYINPGNINELKDQLIRLKNNGKIFDYVSARVV